MSLTKENGAYKMIYFSSNMVTEDIVELIKHVDIDVFCLWQEERGKEVFGAVKDSGYELFVVACSLYTIKHMKYLNRDQVSQTLSHGEPLFVCGNRTLLEF